MGRRFNNGIGRGSSVVVVRDPRGIKKPTKPRHVRNVISNVARPAPITASKSGKKE